MREVRRSEVRRTAGQVIRTCIHISVVLMSPKFYPLLLPNWPTVSLLFSAAIHPAIPVPRKTTKQFILSLFLPLVKLDANPLRHQSIPPPLLLPTTSVNRKKKVQTGAHGIIKSDENKHTNFHAHTFRDGRTNKSVLMSWLLIRAATKLVDDYDMIL